MNQDPNEDEIEKILENLAYSSQADAMAQKVYFMETEAIRQKGVKSERIVDALKNIAANDPSVSARKEASKTLIYLGITPPAINETPLTKKGAAKIGVMIGLVPTILVFVFYSIVLHPFYGLIFILVTLAPLTIPGGIVGGLIGYQMEKTRGATVGSAILGTILVSIIVLFYLMRFGSPFGVPQ